MLRRDCVSYEKLNFVMREESAIRAKDKKLFFDTHYPIKLFDGRNRQTIEESELKKKILDAPGVRGTRIFLIKGNPGTGKSEFCWYFKLKAEEEGVKRKIIHIPKSEVEPGKVARILLEACEDVDFDQKSYQENWKILKENTDAVAKKIFYQLIIEKYGSPSEKEFAVKLKEAESVLLEYILTWLKYQIYMAESSGRFSPEHLTESFDRVGIMKSLEEKGISDFDIEYFEYEFHRKIIDFLNLPSIEILLKKISDKFKHQRPIIIIEDLVGIGAARTIILNTLSDLARMDIDLVAGVIPAMEESVKKSLMRGVEEIDQASRELGTETLIERSYEYSLTSDTGESTFLNSKESVIAFIKPYLKHVREFECKECKLNKVCKSLFNELYPFNEEFIWRIFQKLGTKKVPRRDPRALIQEVRSILEESRNRGNKVWEIATSKFGRPFTFRQDIEKYQDFANFVSWYGRAEQENQISISKKLIDFFEVDYPKDVLAKNGNFLIPFIYSQTLVGRVETEPVDRKTKHEPPEPSPKVIQAREFTKRWLDGEKNIPLIALRQGLAYLLSKEIGKKPTLIVDKSVDKPKRTIEWTKKYQNEDIPIVFEDEEPPPFPHLYVLRTEIHDVSFLLTDLGVAENAQERNEIIRRIRDEHFEVIRLLQTKIEECKEEFKKYLERELGISDLNEWIICSYALCKMLLLGQTNIKNIQILDDKQIRQLDKPKWLFPEFLHNASDVLQIKQCYEILSQLIDNISIVNKSRIFTSLSKDKLLNLSKTKVPDRYKFNFEISPSAPISFFAVISTIQRVSNDLKNKDQIRKPSDRFANIIRDAKYTAEFGEIIIEKEKLQEVIEKLKLIGGNPLYPTTAYELREIISHLESLAEGSDFEDLKWILENCKEIETLSNFNDVFELNRVFYIHYWLCNNRTYELIQKLSAIIDKNIPPGGWGQGTATLSLAALENLENILNLITGGKV